MKLAKSYNPSEYETTIYAMWESSGAFKPTGVGEPYCVVMPPPNANGNLHVGHALTISLEDILARYYRMKGRDVAYLPGADHAGFETWVVYEKELEKGGKSRFDFSREELYNNVWKFVDQQRGTMELQLRALGASASWEDLVFTLDRKVIETVYSTFKRLWDEKLIYRGERIVNYCTKHQTSFADIEVEHKNEAGKLWDIAYPTMDHIGEIIVSTTRPETMLGDMAIAVHPDDERYQKFIGSTVFVPLARREIPVIADQYVDMSYGTGAVKVTPAHDPNDFEIGQRHQLELMQVIGFDGKMMNVPHEFEGVPVQEARAQVLAALRAEDALRGEKSIEHAVGHCYKCGTAIEPMVKEQWFLHMQPLAERAISAIENGEVTFTPENKGRVLANYLRGLKDWNLSRQIPWGIPIPAFYNEHDMSDWIFDTRVDQQTIDVNGTTYRREEDTFDTWFSSAQWPYITTDYLTNGDLSRFYPNSVMETGVDLLDRWVARMIMMGLYATDQVPFRHVYLNGLVLDEKGQKMSKSKGNVINPMATISEYGSDALRLGVVSNRSAAQNQAFSTATVVAGRNFCNKLWNVARFIEGKLGDEYTPSTPEVVSLADHWIVYQLNAAIATVDAQMADYRFAEAAETVYHVIWDDVADWYLEASKVAPNSAMLAWVLDTALRLAHPFAPFVTETIWQALTWHDDLLMQSTWPTPLECSDIAAAQFGRLKRLVAETRYVISELPGSERYTMLYMDDALVEDNREVITHLARLKAIEHVDQPRGIRLAASGRDAWLDIDADTLYEHQSNLEKRLVAAREERARLEARLANDSYVAQAPAALVEETRTQLAAKEALIERLVAELEVLS